MNRGSQLGSLWKGCLEISMNDYSLYHQAMFQVWAATSNPRSYPSMFCLTASCWSVHSMVFLAYRQTNNSWWNPCKLLFSQKYWNYSISRSKRLPGRYGNRCSSDPDSHLLQKECKRIGKGISAWFKNAALAQEKSAISNCLWGRTVLKSGPASNACMFRLIPTCLYCCCTSWTTRMGSVELPMFASKLSLLLP